MDVTQLKQVQLKLGILVLILGINLRPIMASVSPLVDILENSLNVNHHLEQDPLKLKLAVHFLRYLKIRLMTMGIMSQCLNLE